MNIQQQPQPLKTVPIYHQNEQFPPNRIATRSFSGHQQ